MEEIIVKIDGKDYKVSLEETPEGKLKIYCEGDVYEVEAKPVVKEFPAEQKEMSEGAKIIKAPLPGIIVDVRVKEGQRVNTGDTLIKLIAMKMENEIVSPKDGVIAKINVKKNDSVNRGDVLIVLE